MSVDAVGAPIAIAPMKEGFPVANFIASATPDIGSDESVHKQLASERNDQSGLQYVGDTLVRLSVPGRLSEYRLPILQVAFEQPTSVIDQVDGIATEPAEISGIGPPSLQLPVLQLVPPTGQSPRTTQMSLEMDPVHIPTPVVLPPVQWTCQ